MKASKRLSWATLGHLEPSWGQLGSKSFQHSSGSLGLCSELAVLAPFGVYFGAQNRFIFLICSGPFLEQFLDIFGAIFGAILGSILGPYRPKRGQDGVPRG